MIVRGRRVAGGDGARSGGQPSGYTTIPQALRAAGQTAEDAVETLSDADCGESVQGVAAVLQGSTAGGAATAFADEWPQPVATWRRRRGQARAGADGHNQLLSGHRGAEPALRSPRASSWAPER